MTGPEVAQVVVAVALFCLGFGFIVGNALAKASRETTIYRVDGVTQEPRFNDVSASRNFTREERPR